MTDSADAGPGLPCVLENETGDADPWAALEANRTRIRRSCTEHGAVLLRGFPVGGVDGFETVVRTLSGAPPLTYSERSSPRSSIKGQVYTSTDYPRDEEIFLHNENSYQASWPLTLYFYCIEPPTEMGATPLADVREVYRRIDPSVREEFEKRKWMVVRNFHPDFGSSWRHVFNTDDRATVMHYCRSRGIDVEWRGDDGLRTRAVREPVHSHPVTGDTVWFNHATFFHLTTQAADVQQGLLEIFNTEDLPSHTYFGDGGVIPDDVVAHLRDCYRSAAVRFDWRKDDVLMVDNMLAAHGRESYAGPRRIAVAMAEPSSTAPAG